MSGIEYAQWWPPKPGDLLRRFTHHGSDGMKIKQVHALVHVVAIFERDGDTLATVAEFLPSRRRWLYSTIRGWCEAQLGEYWPDGQPTPVGHHPCDACRGGQ